MPRKKEIVLTIISLALICIFNSPLLSIFNKEGFTFSIPNLYIGLFGVWLVAIIGTFIIVNPNDNNTTDEHL